MLKKKWWIKKGLLTSGLDPSNELARVADHLGDEYTPMLFMTGDGHRSPPFTWTTQGVWPEFFRDLVQMNGLCCHVEKYSDKVTRDDVPVNLRPVFNNGKVFGWEPDFFKVLQSVMETCFEVMAEPKVPLGVMGKIANSLRTVEAMSGHLGPEAAEATDFYLAGLKVGSDPVPMTELKEYETWLKKFAGTRAMQLRTEIHPIVGATIQAKVDHYSDHIHLITCGDAHITCPDPLYAHITPTAGTFGVADESQGPKKKKFASRKKNPGR